MAQQLAQLYLIYFLNPVFVSFSSDVPCFASSQFLPPADCDLLFLSLLLVSAKGCVGLRERLFRTVATPEHPMLQTIKWVYMHGLTMIIPVGHLKAKKSKGVM